MKIIELSIDHLHLPFDENGFVDWLIDAEPGAATAYYRGSLSHDRCESTKVHSPENRRRLIAIAKRALAAEESGSVHLVQRRLGEADFIYIAVRAAQRLPRASFVAPDARVAGRMR